MKQVKKILLISVLACLSYGIYYVIDLERGAEKGRNIMNKQNALLDEWYSKHNPSHDSNCQQPTEEELRQIRIKARKGIN